jgi:excisionase family DNA binding protein
MKPQGIDLYLTIETALADFVREIVHEQLRKSSPETREPLDRLTRRTETDPDELLTVGQVARELQVIPPTVRTWIQSGALRASRPGNGLQPGRTYRIRRTDLDAFVAASTAPDPCGAKPLP